MLLIRWEHTEPATVRMSAAAVRRLNVCKRRRVGCWCGCHGDDAGLVHEENVHKMQLLTFVQLAEGKSELSFETIEKELHLAADDVEAFIINGK